MQTLICLAILITGGLRYDKKASIYIPSSNQSCFLPDLPTRRYYHSQVGLRACGGTPNGRTTCDTWKPETGSWNAEDVTLIGARAGNSWTTAKGTYLIGSYGYGDGAYGGWENAKTSDLLKPDGTVVPGFNTNIYIKYAIGIRTLENKKNFTLISGAPVQLLIQKLILS